MLALCWHSLALGLQAVINASHCDETCTCSCPHSGSYDFDWSPSGEIAEQWSEHASTSLLQFISRLDEHEPSVEKIESLLDWWWRGENRTLRRALERNHARVCERGFGFLVNRTTREVKRARCKSWRECEHCALVYGWSVERLVGQVKALRAFVVFTMPAELGDWSNKAHLAAQARAMRRLAERLCRKFKRRFSTIWTREHNTKGRGPGRLHLNMLWDEKWVDQGWLSRTAKECGFGEIVHISRVRDDGLIVAGEGKGRRIARYATKCLRYVSKDLGQQADWPKYTRRWGASRRAREQMSRPSRDPAWYWSPTNPPLVPVSPEERTRLATTAEERVYWLLPDAYLPSHTPRAPRPRDGPTLAPLPDRLIH